jgi:hypothetical protein
MGINEWWKQKRAAVSADAHKLITGVDPRTSRPLMDEHDVLMQIATMVRELFDGGADPILLIQAYMTGAVWLADNSGISREQLVQLVQAIELKRDRSLIFQP